MSEPRPHLALRHNRFGHRRAPALPVVLGNAAPSNVGEEALAALPSFAGGAVLASLADTLMPGAYREGSPPVAFATAAGFLLSFLVAV